MPKFSVTYEVITEESAEHGEADEYGYEIEGESLRDCWEFLRWQGGHCEANCSDITQATWLSFYCDADCMTGETKNFGLHFPAKLTGASRKRIAKLFGCYGLR